MLQKEEANRRRIFSGVEKGAVKNKNNVLLTMIKDRTDQGHKWMKEKHREEFKFLEGKQCERIVPMIKDNAAGSARDAEEFMKK